jgi:hypothetical protein
MVLAYQQSLLILRQGQRRARQLLQALKPGYAEPGVYFAFALAKRPAPDR